MKSRSWFALVSGTLLGAIVLASCAPNPVATTPATNPATNPATAPADSAPPLEAQTAESQTETANADPDVPYVPTPQVVVDRMLQLAEVGSNDVVYDLGSGDGRLVITAVDQFGASRGVGIEIQPQLVTEANQKAQAEGISDRATFRQEDLFKTDFSNASVVTLYLLPRVNLELRPRLLAELKPGTRIVSHDFDMGDWEPDEVVQVQGPNRTHTIYKWTVPEEIPENLRG
ncbi:SAM-dependent methyltransferase [Leptolyngbya ohadii]|uniref:SAM-dependent methyltransferase n=1 Tax=Leptolyngbya ohadii TaxID=1962290 RepID=UPI000B59CE97|nr:class I SAM-dependent methyltransferase [Leptolyngbya ohadii]